MSTAAVRERPLVTDPAPLSALAGGGAQPPVETLSEIAERAERAGLRRVHILAWRDLDDPEAGGSELHAHRVATLWADAGIDVTVRTSVATGHPTHAERDGYRVVRKAGRYAVFPRTALSGFLGRTGPRDGLVEIWNGMPFFSPVWAHCPRIVFLHHVHAEMWRMVLTPRLARLGELVEFKIAPRLYRRAQVVTLSESSKREIVSLLGLPADNVSVVAPGVDGRFCPGGPLSPRPLVVAVGRLVPVKRFDLLIDALAELAPRHPGLEAVIVGEGYERSALEARVRRHGAEDWISLPGHLADDELVDLYRRAWVLASSSAREGWGMTITEAGACATPSVATRIGGHVDAIEHGQTGLLAEDPADLVGHLDIVLGDPELAASLGKAAMEHATALTWKATARGTLEVLAREAERGRSRRGAPSP
jgi:glycosyltransferase involved in cell wall biosynthesis